MPKCKEMLSLGFPAENASFPLTMFFFKFIYKIGAWISASMRGFHAM